MSDPIEYHIPDEVKHEAKKKRWSDDPLYYVPMDYYKKWKEATKNANRKRFGLRFISVTRLAFILAAIYFAYRVIKAYWL